MAEGGVANLIDGGMMVQSAAAGLKVASSVGLFTFSLFSLVSIMTFLTPDSGAVAQGSEEPAELGFSVEPLPGTTLGPIPTLFVTTTIEETTTTVETTETTVEETTTTVETTIAPTTTVETTVETTIPTTTVPETSETTATTVETTASTASTASTAASTPSS